MAGWTSKSVTPKDSVDLPPKPSVDAAPPGQTWRPDADGKLTPGQWAGNKKTEAHWLAGASAGEKWDPYLLVTEAEYDDAIHKAKNHTFGHPHGHHLKHITHAIPPVPVPAAEVAAPEASTPETKAEADAAAPTKATKSKDAPAKG